MIIVVFITVIVVSWVGALLFPPLLAWLNGMKRQMLGKRTANIFEHQYVESKAFYLYRFKTIPCTTFVDDIDVSKAFGFVKSDHGDQIIDTYQACFFNRQMGRQEFSKTIFVLKNRVVVELAGRYARILYPGSQYGFADKMLNAFNEFKLPEKKEDFEINIISYSNHGLDLKKLDIKPTTLEIGMYYNDDFKEVDDKIRKRLRQRDDKGIVLLHGLPGTGKTTYLRHLVGGMDKRVLFVSPSVAGNLMNPEFIDLLIDNPNSVLIIEDAENIIMDRKYNSDSSVSNLLNLSDGLLSDCLSVQIICTFNSSLSMIDSALMRKGRLIAKYEFGKLTIEKSQLLSTHLEFDTVIKQPMTIAEIAHQDDKQYEARRVEVIGFRQEQTMMN